MAKWQKRAVGLCFLAAVSLFSGCAAHQSASTIDHSADVNGSRIVAISEQLVGAPYRFGGESPSGFDCSGLVRYVYRQVGINVPHSSRLLYQRSQKVDFNDLQPGDLLFFNISKKKVSHVGIYQSKGTFIHAPSSGKSVSIGSLENRYWKNKLVAAGRWH